LSYRKIRFDAANPGWGELPIVANLDAANKIGAV
jgi:hypothetical protein